MKKMNTAAALLLACCMIFSFSGCMATTGNETYKNELLYATDVAGLYAPEEEAAYRAENWEPSEKLLCDVLLKNNCERTVAAPGASYTKAFPSGEIQECLNILDGGKEFYGKEAGRIGFQYFYSADEKIKEELTEVLGSVINLNPHHLELLQNSDAAKNFSFASIAEELEKLDTLFQALGLGEMDCSLAIAMDPGSLNKIRAEIDPAAPGGEEYRFSEEGFYLFLFRRTIDETYSAWNEQSFLNTIQTNDKAELRISTDMVRVVTGRDGTIYLEVYGFPKISGVIEEKEVVPAAEAIRAVDEICREKLSACKKEVVSGEFCYINIRDEDDFIKRLQPCWNFSVRVTEPVVDQDGKPAESVQYYAFIVNALNGRLIETDQELLSPEGGET